jgi:DNA-binding FadR family transcriptional regulator
VGGNAFLETLLKQLYDQMLVAFPAVFMTPLIPRFIEDHIQIYEALESLNPKRAKTLIRKHEQRTLNLLQDYR